MVGLGDRGDHLPGQLSGGEMQRVAIGRALINNPRSSWQMNQQVTWDSAASQMILELFKELNRRGITLIIVTHNLDLARKAHKMYTLKDGQIVCCKDLSYLQG